jgi:hypothetical protein
MVIKGLRRIDMVWWRWRPEMSAFLNRCRRLLNADRIVFFAFCAVHPINPMCCPTPCPISDSFKIADFAVEAGQAWQNVEKCRQIADGYFSLTMAFGPNGPVASELRRFPGSVAGAFKTFQTSVPSPLKAEDLNNPRAVSEILKASVFDLNVSELTVGVGRVALRAGTVADEAVNALASSMHGYKRLTDVVVDRGLQTVSAASAKYVRGDLAANASAREALVDNLSGFRELLSVWAAIEATVSSTAHATTLGTLPFPTSSGQSSFLTDAAQAKIDRLRRLRLMRLAVNQLDTTISALTALHNERHAVAVMLAQYSGLRNTVASDNQAIQFRAADAATAVSLLTQIFTDGKAVFQSAQGQLLSLDTTSWKDSATKMATANEAAQTVVGAIFFNPQAYGTLQSDSFSQDGFSSSAVEFSQVLASSFSSWLEDDKLERFWAPLRQDASAAISSLDQRLREINDRRGFDISGPEAMDRENALLRQIDQQFQVTLNSTLQASNDSQKAILTSYITAFQTAVAAIKSDISASNFVAVRWPT